MSACVECGREVIGTKSCLPVACGADVINRVRCVPCVTGKLGPGNMLRDAQAYVTSHAHHCRRTAGR